MLKAGLKNMNNIDERLKRIEIENFIWVIYLFIIFLSFYSNYLEKDYVSKFLGIHNLLKKWEEEGFIKGEDLFAFFKTLKKRFCSACTGCIARRNGKKTALHGKP